MMQTVEELYLVFVGECKHKLVCLNNDEREVCKRRAERATDLTYETVAGMQKKHIPLYGGNPLENLDYLDKFVPLKCMPVESGHIHNVYGGSFTFFLCTGVIYTYKFSLYIPSYMFIARLSRFQFPFSPPTVSQIQSTSCIFTEMWKCVLAHVNNLSKSKSLISIRNILSYVLHSNLLVNSSQY